MSNNKVLKNTLWPYRNLVVVGGNWGDEGKGKIIDLVMEHYDVTVRFSGGANAGHTVFTPDHQKLVSHLIPCGLAQHKECVMGRGELVDLRLFLEELEQAKKVLGGRLPKIYLDQMSPLWTPWHGLLEAWLEFARGKGKVGTTGKGIGPLEGLYKLRIAPLVGQVFLERKKFIGILELLYKTLQPVFKEMRAKGLIVSVGNGRDRSLQGNIPNPTQVADLLRSYAPKIKPFVTDTSFVLHQGIKNKQRMLFEGAQALGLDSRFGTYPYVSSGNSAAFGASEGTGLPMQSFGATLMVVKTLPTRVGSGPFPSEMWRRQEAMEFVKKNIELFTDKSAKAEFLNRRLEKINAGKASNAELSQYFQVLGDERGATTGRGRSVGFIDIPWLLYSIRINGPKWLALTRFDMLSGVKTVPVVVGYRLNGKLLAPGQLPPPWDMDKVNPVFENWPGWKENIYGLNDEKTLPKAANNFLNHLENHLKTQILLVGTGPGRKDIVVRV
ncbi:MAG: adenylosuccinate synthetase [Candidatus Doudnabacteria bacterium]|nr:adenylosuccinate synthetase [Candidatus Doudnabacteria bacterium]